MLLLPGERISTSIRSLRARWVRGGFGMDLGTNTLLTLGTYTSRTTTGPVSLLPQIISLSQFHDAGTAALTKRVK